MTNYKHKQIINIKFTGYPNNNYDFNQNCVKGNESQYSCCETNLHISFFNYQKNNKCFDFYYNMIQYDSNIIRLNI